MIDWKNSTDRKMAFKFPSVAAELLACGNANLLQFFMNEPESGAFTQVKSIFKFFSNSRKEEQTNYNYTRSGYLCKILNTLILHRGGALVSYLMKTEKELPRFLLENCHCRSVVGTLQVLLLLLPLNVQTPMMMAQFQNGNDKTAEPVSSQVAAEVVLDTLNERLALFEEAIMKFIETANHEEHYELHCNLSYLLHQILSKNSVEFSAFWKALSNKMPDLMKKFFETIQSEVNNKLGHVLFFHLDIKLKESIAQKVPDSELPMEQVSDNLAALLKALQESMVRNSYKSSSSRTIRTFSSEVHKLNSKVYKIFEIVNFAMTNFMGKENFSESIFHSNNMPQFIFAFLTDFPFNSLLHNLVRKFLVNVIQKGSESLLSLFFFKNETFLSFLEQLVENRIMELMSKKNLRKGYIGQVIIIGNTLHSRLKTDDLDFLNGKLKRSRLDDIPAKIPPARTRFGEENSRRHRLPGR